MKLSNLKNLPTVAIDTLKNYPMVMLSALVTSIVFILFIDSSANYNTNEFFEWWRSIMVLAMGVPLFLSINILINKNNLSKIISLIFNIGVILILVIYYFLFGKYESSYIRFALYAIAGHLLVCYAAFIKKESDDEFQFWEFNKSLFIRFLNSALFSVLLFIGLTLAISSMNILFNINWNNKIYGKLAVILFGLFNTWYFLAGIPRNFNQTEIKLEFPKLLKLFTQFVLIPLLIIYIGILYAYIIKIIIEWELPKGWTSSLILTCASIGILAYLLIYPLKKDENNKWAILFSKWFFGLMIPLVILMSVAVYRRIGDYGITENRYFLIIITIWLFIISIYFTLSKRKNIKFIPISMIIISLLISFGPWGAFSISENSQINCVMNILKNNKIINNNKIEANIKLSDTVGIRLTQAIQYLERTHGFENLISKINTTVPDFNLTQNDTLKTKDIKLALGIKDIFSKSKSLENFFCINSYLKKPLSILGYDLFLKYNSNFGTSQFKFKDATRSKFSYLNIISSNNIITDISMSYKEGIFSVILKYSNKSSKESDIFNLNLYNIIDSIASKPEDEITYQDFISEAPIGNNSIKIILNKISYYSDSSKILNFEADVFIK